MTKTAVKPMLQNARVIAYSISDDVELQVRKNICDILEYHGCMDLMAPIYTSVKELLINAIKANYKNIYFENYSPKNRSLEIVKYEKALELFNLEMSREHASYFEEYARKDDIKAEIDMWTEDKVLHVQVANTAKMTASELQNVKNKLSDAESCKDIADYCIRNINDPYREGAGLGLILIIMMLKSLKAPKDSFLISSDHERTTAYLRIPLNKNIKFY